MTWTADSIKQLQSDLGLKNAEFAARVGASVHSVEQWRGGFRTPRAKLYVRKLNRLAETVKK